MATVAGIYAVTVSIGNPARRVWRFFGWLAGAHKRALTQHHFTEAETRFIRSFAGWLTISGGLYLVLTVAIWAVFWATFGMQQVLVIGGALVLARFSGLPLLRSAAVVIVLLAVIALPTALFVRILFSGID